MLRRALVVVTALAFLAPLWLGKYPPFVDLPQHAAQLSMWQHLHDPAFGFDGRYVVDWRTPYLLAYLCAMPFVGLGALVALKIVISLFVLALPAALWLFLRSGDEDPQFALLGFPLAYGFSLSWGFIPCALASVPALLLLALVRRHLSTPTQRTTLLLAAVGVVLFYAHALIFAFTLVLALLMALTRGARAPLRLWPLLLSVLVALSWYARVSVEAQANRSTVWAESVSRLLWSTSLQLGHPHDAWAAIVGALLLSIPLVASRPASLVRSLPFVATLVAVLFAPHYAFGTAYLYGRFSIFLLPTLLYALEPKRQVWSRYAIVALCVAWAVVLDARALAFGREARSWDQIEAAMRPNRSVRAIVLQRASAMLPGRAPVYQHFPVYYQADKGGLVGSSFAESNISFVQYVDPSETRVSPYLEANPERFDVRAEPPYDYYVVRAPTEPSLFSSDPSVTLTKNSGEWWLYERR